MRTRLLALVTLGLALGGRPLRAQALGSEPCPPAQAEQPPSTALAEVPTLDPTPAPPLAAPPAPVPLAVTDVPLAVDYRHRIRATPLGWARLSTWCVWVEPVMETGPTALWQQRWHRAVLAALGTWSGLVPITLVNEPARAQILLERRRPPLQQQDGRWRASHGRALLRLRRVQRQQLWRLEPQVRVLIGMGQAEAALQATVLHELGHAFGLWGHSDAAADAMAATPGPRPQLSLSERDQRTVRWLYQQPTVFGRPEGAPPPAGNRQ